VLKIVTSEVSSVTSALVGSSLTICLSPASGGPACTVPPLWGLHHSSPNAWELCRAAPTQFPLPIPGGGPKRLGHRPGGGEGPADLLTGSMHLDRTLYSVWPQRNEIVLCGASSLARAGSGTAVAWHVCLKVAAASRCAVGIRVLRQFQEPREPARHELLCGFGERWRPRSLVCARG
jgi:hypothetical protein